MSLEGLDLVSVSRSLSQLATQDDDLVDAFLERLEVVEMQPASRGAGVTMRREEGFAVRLSRGDQSWMATGDSLAPDDLLAAFRQVARTWPQTAYPAPDVHPPEWPETTIGSELPRFPSALTRALKRRLVAFPLEVLVRRYRRWIQVVGPRLVSEAQSETYFSIDVEMPWGRRALLATTLGESTVNELADILATAFEARDRAAPESAELPIVLSQQATAVFLHEAVAHALEADTLAGSGRVEAAVGLRMGSEGLSVLDDPGSAPAGVRRSSDDEGRPVERRWLLRDGVVEQPLADMYWAQRSSALLPGAGRRGGRMDPPSPRSTHLMLLPGEATSRELMAGEGLWVPQVVRGRLDVASGSCRLHAPFGFRFHQGQLGDTVGAFALEGQVAALLEAVEAIGSEAVSTGAGWCAKGRQRLPVWATTPPMRLGCARVTG